MSDMASRMDEQIEAGNNLYDNMCQEVMDLQEELKLMSQGVIDLSNNKLNPNSQDDLEKLAISIKKRLKC